MICFLIFLLSMSQPAIDKGASITGLVSDDYGSPVTGAVVSVIGEDTGDVTDGNGWYHMNLEPGSYVVLASMPGMGNEVQEDVEVLEGESYRLDFELVSLPAYELMPAVGYDNSSIPQFSSLNSDTIRSMPVSGIMEVVERQPGIENSGLRCGSIKFFANTQSQYYKEFSTLNACNESHLHMRGGRSGEVVYIVDGFTHRNPLNSGFISSIPISSIRETSAVRGSLNAQYGNALSGTVEIETLEGGSSYHGGISLSGNDWQALGLADNWTWGGTSIEGDPTLWRLSNVSPFSEARLEFGARIGGPEPLTSYLLPEIGIGIPGDMRIFIDGELLQTGGGENGRYGYGFDEWETSYRGIIKLTYDPSPSTKINLSTSFLDRTSGWFGVGNYWAWSRYEVPYIDTVPESPAYGDTLYWGRNILYGLPTRFWNNSSIGLCISHVISDETSIQLGIGQYRTSFDYRIRNDPESTDPMRQTEWLGENWSWNDWQEYETDLYTDVQGFIREGTSRFPWNESRSTTTTLKADITTGIGREHTLGVGIDGSYYDIFSYDIIANSNSVNQNRYSAFPNSGGVYLQDRIEHNDGFVMNAGVRFDYFDANYERTSRPYIIPPPPSFQRDVLNEIEAPTKFTINPRLSFYCPVTERETLHFTYGVYSQIPAFSQMYRQADYSFSEEIPLGGNPDLDFERTVQYEIGLTSEICENFMINLAGYIKNISNMVETDMYYLSHIGDYALYTNGGYGESKGLEITFNGHPDGFFSWNVSYILSKSTGTSSHALQNYLYSLNGFSNADTDQYLDWDQLHTVYADLHLYVPRGRGYRIAGVPVFQGLGVHLSWSFGSGFPYTHAYQGIYEPRINEGRYPATNTASLKINKAFWFSNMTLDAWCEVTNLFNRHNLDTIQDISWYEAEPGCGWPYNKDPTGPLGNHYTFCRPRMIRFGLGLNW